MFRSLVHSGHNIFHLFSTEIDCEEGQVILQLDKLLYINIQF